MSILSFFRRTKSRDAEAVDDFARVVEQTGILTEKQRIDQIAEIISKDEDLSAAELNRLGNLLSGKS